jgi:hypothetical protein
MGKKLSANELQQHNDRLSQGKEDKVNSLIERLDQQKEQLPESDHSIIDWGISLLHRYSGMTRKFSPAPNSEIDPQSYEKFITESGWINFNEDSLYDDFANRIHDEFIWSDTGYQGLKTNVENLYKCLEKFLLSKEENSNNAQKWRDALASMYADKQALSLQTYREKKEKFPEESAKYYQDSQSYSSILEGLGYDHTEG